MAIGPVTFSPFQSSKAAQALRSAQSQSLSFGAGQPGITPQVNENPFIAKQSPSGHVSPVMTRPGLAEKFQTLYA